MESAKKEFLAHGFERASLKAICEDAGVTTDALYKKFKGKEELFRAVVADTVKALNDFVEMHSAAQACDLTDEELIKAWEMNESMLLWFHFLYQYHDGFVLLISGASGTDYGFFGKPFPSMTVAYINALGLEEIKLEIEIWAAK